MENPQDSLATPTPFGEGAFDGFSMIADDEEDGDSDSSEATPGRITPSTF